MVLFDGWIYLIIYIEGFYYAWLLLLCDWFSFEWVCMLFVLASCLMNLIYGLIGLTEVFYFLVFFIFHLGCMYCIYFGVLGWAFWKVWRWEVRNRNQFYCCLVQRKREGNGYELMLGLFCIFVFSSYVFTDNYKNAALFPFCFLFLWFCEGNDESNWNCFPLCHLQNREITFYNHISEHMPTENGNRKQTNTLYIRACLKTFSLFI